MPVRFTCRLVALPAPGGKFRVQYAPLADLPGDGSGRLFTFIGPRVVEPPAGEMPEDELMRWEMWLVHAHGYRTQYTLTPGAAALVEAHRTYEDEIPKGAVAADLFWAELDTGEKTLGVSVRSGWDREVPNFSLAADYAYDAPQPTTSPPGIEAKAVGGSDSLFGPIGFRWPGLRPGAECRFALRPSALPVVRSRAASLSPESHWLALKTDGYEFDRVPGGRVAAFLADGE